MQVSNVRKCFFIDKFLLFQINTDNPHQKPLPMIDQVQQNVGVIQKGVFLHENIKNLKLTLNISYTLK